MTNAQWIDYWCQDSVLTDSKIWQINTEYFFHRAQRSALFTKDDSILNIGCGPGYLEVLLAPFVKHIHAVDIAEPFVQLCTERCKDFPNISIARLDKDYTNLTHLGKSFSFILCLSVIQYYKNIDEIEALITSAQKIALPGARMLIGDIPRSRSLIGIIWDMLSSFLTSLRKGYSVLLVRDVWNRLIRRSHYKSVSQTVKPLSFTIKELEQLIHRLQLNAIIIRKSFSIYANRPSLLIQL